jgi:hypothetical protein
MRIIYVDAFSGISGDMILGAMIDLGVSVPELEAQLKQHLILPEYQLLAHKVSRGSIMGTKLDIKIVDPAHTRYSLSAPQIRKILEDSSLKPLSKQKALKIFGRLVEAEAQVHGVEPDEVHFHELGGIDTVIDIVGAVLGFELLACQRIVSSPLNLGSGTVTTCHGTLPVPAPATLELLTGIPAYGSTGQHELTTPTGAAIVTTLAQEFAPLPLMQVEKYGYGAGSQDFPERPNMLRLIQGEALATTWQEDEVMIIETNIDNMNPEFYQPIMDKLFQQGALDVTLTPITMKKGRPAIKLTIISDYYTRDRLIHTLFKETTSLGIRFYPVQRKKLPRQIRVIETSYGPVKVKLSSLDNQSDQITPELDDCQKIANKLGIPLREVYEEVRTTAQSLLLNNPAQGEKCCEKKRPSDK